MPEWLSTIVIAVISGLFGAGGLAAYLKVRSDARITREAQQDDHTLALINAQGASEAEFRNAVIKAYEYEVSARRDLDVRLTETQKQLTIVGLERDELKRQRDIDQRTIDGLEHQVKQLQYDLSAAHEMIRLQDAIIATLQKGDS
jgi:hypothetical protein